jgi:hypothetical protein
VSGPLRACPESTTRPLCSALETFISTNERNGDRERQGATMSTSLIAVERSFSLSGSRTYRHDVHLPLHANIKAKSRSNTRPLRYRPPRLCLVLPSLCTLVLLRAREANARVYLRGDRTLMTSSTNQLAPELEIRSRSLDLSFMLKYHRKKRTTRIAITKCFDDNHKKNWCSDSAEVYKIDYKTAIIYPTE